MFSLDSIRKRSRQSPPESCCLPTALYDVTSQTTMHRLFLENEIIKFLTGVLTQARVIYERPIFTNYHSCVLIYVRLHMCIYTKETKHKSFEQSRYGTLLRTGK